jgi:glycolate oxidase FAD binding subunit
MQPPKTLRPETETDLAGIIRESAEIQRPLEVIGLGGKRGVGRPLQTAAILTTEAFSGVTLYEPTELVLSAKAGTPLREIEATLAEHKQELAFEPVDLGPALGDAPGGGSIGAVFATNLSGSRRSLAGAARDHLIGVKAVNGRGEAFKSGGRVMKNVTGYDLARGLAGSWGTLAVMTEVTMKVLPRPETSHTLLIRGLTDGVAVEALALASASPNEVSGAIHLQGAFAARMPGAREGDAEALTGLRVESFSASVRARTARLKALLQGYGALSELTDERSRRFWQAMRELRFIERGKSPVWRIAAPAARSARIVADVSRYIDCRAAYDWAGGLIWLETAPLLHAGAIELRRALNEHGGQATLIRGEAATRAAVDVFQPLDAGLARLTANLKQAFDPDRVLNPGRMYAGV